MSKFWHFINNFNPIGRLINGYKSAKGLYSMIKKTANGIEPDMLSSNVNSGIQNLLKGVTGAGLTDAQKESNAFEAEQAQKQMDFQERMRNTSFQAQVNDMKSAGVNPALAFGGTSNGATVPSGAMAQSESPGQPDLVGLLGQIQNLALLKAQKNKTEAETRNLDSNSALAKQRAKNLEVEFDISTLQYAKDSVEYEYFERMQQLAYEIKVQDLEKSKLENQSINKRLAQQSADFVKTWYTTLEIMANTQLLQSKKDLTDEEKKQVTEYIKLIKANVTHLKKQDELLAKEIQYYFINHAAAGVVGVGKKAVKAVSKVVPKWNGLSKAERLEELSHDWDMFLSEYD